MKIDRVSTVEFIENEDDFTVMVDVSEGDKSHRFYVQTTDGEHRPALGCLIYTDTSNGDVDYDDYPYDFYEIIDAVEDFVEKHSEEYEENPEYLNKDATPYTCRYIKSMV